MATLSKQYDPNAHESGIYKQWEDSGAFQPNEEALKAGKQPYTIMLPPPNITGTLHMGHALQDTIMDILIRMHRMQGDPTLWLAGTDHAAIATNKVIENQLAEEGISRHDIGREAFQDRVDKWYTKTGAEIIDQMKRLGCSCDWSRLRFTMDDDYVRAVNETFLRFYEAGYIYRGERLVNWDPKSQTTVSDLEIDWKTEKNPFYTFKYGPFEIGTARPETKFGDKYVVMHPDDDRYAEYKHGDTFEAEWINGPVTATVIKDEAAVPEFGTGVMTITPWHDQTDFELAERHNLDKEQIINFEGKLLPIAEEFAGMTIEEARPKIVKKLEDKGLLVSIDKTYEHNVALNDRGKGVIEPQIMRQWFVDMQKLKGETIDVAQNDLISFLPPRWKKHFLTWLDGVLDWNINRQIWLGHRLPVWWKPGTHDTDNEAGNFAVSVEKPEGDWEQDPDVLDTWFSSALWPFATLGWPDNTEDLKRFYPSTVLTTAREILFLWVVRMVFSGLELMKGEEYGNRSQAERIPFKEVFIHPMVHALDGQRMSKSLGTGVDPLELIEQYGADATRFGLMYQMTYDNQAIKFDEEVIKSSRNFANKIWNIARFLENLSPSSEGEPEGVADIWIQSRLDQVTSQVTKLIDEYKIGEAARVLYDFIWKDFADWYVEILKVEGSTKVARATFQQTLKILHPFMPHLTEVLWEGEDMLITSPWPSPSSEGEPEGVEAITAFQDIVTAIRSARTLLNVPPSEQMKLFVEKPPLPNAISALTNTELVNKPDSHMKSIPTQAGQTLMIASVSINEKSIKAALKKLEKQVSDLDQLITSQQTILKNMRGKAPEDKIQEKEQVIASAEEKLAALRKSLLYLK